jgi:BirA family biotin operon repressor/biotin-[acetyl-CoA-carboxylase] ligase
LQQVLPTGHQYLIHEEIDSTSLEAKRLVEAGQITGPLWILARRQTAGYGRRGRGWEQRVGDFAGTLILPLEDQTLLHQPAIASFGISLAVDAALQEVGVPSDRIMLKWPNDVLLERGKVCGLLLETAGEGNRQALLVGIGINIVNAPEIEAYSTAKISDHLGSTPVPLPEDVLRPLDQTFADWLSRAAAEGLAPLRRAWAARVGGIGEQIIVRLPDKELTGIFEGVAEDGALILRQGEQLQHITAGDVFFAG